MSKLTPKEEAHSQLPKVCQLRPGITTKPSSLSNAPSLVSSGPTLHSKSKHRWTLAWARHLYERFTCESCRIIPILQTRNLRLRGMRPSTSRLVTKGDSNVEPPGSKAMFLPLPSPFLLGKNRYGTKPSARLSSLPPSSFRASFSPTHGFTAGHLQCGSSHCASLEGTVPSHTYTPSSAERMRSVARRPCYAKSRLPGLGPFP